MGEKGSVEKKETFF